MPSNEFPQFITQCKEDENGDLAFEIPQELLEALDWNEETVIDISVIGERIVLREVKQSDPEETP
jgi:antitoxin component of MazEF toxin-antitoxin module